MEVISTRRYEARPPPAAVGSSSNTGVVVDPENSVALVKEEEWETRKKKEITTTRQIETRVKRQVVLEDGEVVVDSGPLVTTNTTEDVERQERTTQERRTTGDPQEVELPSAAIAESGNLLQQELNETIVKSREEIEERLETEDHRQLGDISDEAYLRAVTSNRGDLRLALAESTKKISRQTGPRVVKHTTRSNKVVDTENTLEKRESKADGSIVTERKTTVEREEIKDDEVPDNEEITGDIDVGDGGGKDDEFEKKKESSRRYAKSRDEEIVDYISGGEKIGRETLYVAETIEGERIGDRSPSPTTEMRTTRFQDRKVSSPMRPGRFSSTHEEHEEPEDEARKFETSKWLESHFGSESRSSRGSPDLEDAPLPTTGYINVTMRSRTPKDRDYEDRTRRRHEEQTWYHEREKQSNISRTSSPASYYAENGHSERARNHQIESSYSRTYESTNERRRKHQERRGTPSPPTRRSSKEKRSVVHEEGEIRDVKVQEREVESPRKSSSRSRSISPKTPPPPVSSREQQKRNEKNRSRTKYKIGESFRKLVGKLRSGSSERKSKRSVSQPTQTEDDDGPTYMRYNPIDRHVPLLAEDEVDGEDVQVLDQPPKRPPRSPKNKASSELILRNDQRRRGDSSPPVHRYYLGEDPFGRNSHGESERIGSRSRVVREVDYSVSTGSLGRYKDDTAAITGRSTYDRRQDGTLPRTYRSGEERSYYRRTHSMPRRTQETTTRTRRNSSRSPPPPPPPIDSNRSDDTLSELRSGTINVSIKNTLLSPEITRFIPIRNDPNASSDFDRTPKSNLSRSTSLNVEMDKVNGRGTRFNVASYANSTPKNRLDETPPLKSPGILASIGRTNRNFLGSNEYEH